MMLLDAARALRVLRRRGIDIAALSNDPDLFDKACRVVYKAIPRPLRWIVGKKRVRRVLTVMRDQYRARTQSSTTPAP